MGSYFLYLTIVVLFIWGIALLSKTDGKRTKKYTVFGFLTRFTIVILLMFLLYFLESFWSNPYPSYEDLPDCRRLPEPEESEVRTGNRFGVCTVSFDSSFILPHIVAYWLFVIMLAGESGYRLWRARNKKDAETFKKNRKVLILVSLTLLLTGVPFLIDYFTPVETIVFNVELHIE